MIEIWFGDCRMEAKGHAGAGSAGADPVCAGVSALVYALVENLKGAEGLVCRLQPGDALVACRPGRQAREKFRFAKRGLVLLGAAFPENVRVTASEFGTFPGKHSYGKDRAKGSLV